MGKLDRDFVYKKFKKILIENFGKDKAKSVWKESNSNLKQLMKKNKEAGFDEKMMVLPLFAIYKGLKINGIENALDLLKKYGEQRGKEISHIIEKITSIPGVSKLLWKNMPSLMKKTSSPKKGYERRIVSETEDLVGVDILTCPLCEMAKKLGAPEIASVVCLIDKGQMSGFKYIEYTRTMSRGDGDEYCDYRLRFNKDKN